MKIDTHNKQVHSTFKNKGSTQLRTAKVQSNHQPENLNSQVVSPSNNDPYIIKLKTITGHNLLTFLDSGSQLSSIKESVSRKLKETGKYKTRQGECTASCASGNTLKMKEQIRLTFNLNGYIIHHWFWVSNQTSYPGAILAGIDFLKHLNVNICSKMNKQIITIQNRVYPIIHLTKSPDTVKLIVKENKNENKSESKNSVKVQVCGKCILKANSLCYIKCNVNSNELNNIHVNNKNFLINSVIARDSGLRVPAAIVNNKSEDKFILPCINFNDQDVEFPNSAIIASAEIIENSELENKLDATPDIKPEEFEKQLELVNLSNLELSQREKLLQLLRANKEAFSTKDAPLGKVDCVVAKIPLNPPDAVVYTPQYRIPHALRETLDEIVEDLLQQDVIKPYVSAFNSPILLVKKPNGSWRFAQDCRNLNKVLVTQTYPLPRITETLDSMKGMNYFTSLDAKSGFHQIMVAEEDQHKLAFRTHKNAFTFKRLTFGLKNSSFIFQSAINCILKDVLGKHSLCYVDDVIVFSKTFDEHLKHLGETFALLIKGGLKLTLEKCKFGQRKLLFLGYQVNGQGIEANPKKIEAIQKIPPPKNEKQIRQFVAAAGFYRNLIPHFAEVTAPLTDLLKKNTKFVWTEKENNAFEELKKILTSNPITMHPDFSQEFQIHCDSSNYAIGSSLMQYDDKGHLKPIAYFSRKLKGAELNYATVEKEALAIVAAIKNYHYYIYGRKFKVITDHAPLCTVFKKTNSQNGRISRWATFLAQYDFTVEHKPGKENIIPDLLSRNLPEDEQNAMQRNDILTQNIPSELCKYVNSVNIKSAQNESVNKSDNYINLLWKNFTKQNLIKEQQNDAFCMQLIRYLNREDIIHAPRARSLDEFCIEDEVLYYLPKNTKNHNGKISMKIVVPESLIEDALNISHVGVMKAHTGFLRTLFKARELFYIPNIIKFVKQKCNSCLECARRKSGVTHKAELGSFPPIHAPMDHVGIDLLGPLPTSNLGNNYIMSIIDHYSHFITLYAIPNKNINTVARYFAQFLLRNGWPINLTSDNGQEFCGELMKKICEDFGIEKHTTTFYHPEGNSLTETYNTSIMNIMHFLLQNTIIEWDIHINYIASAINSAYCTQIQNVPFYLFHARDFNFPYSLALEGKRTFYDLDSNFAHELQMRVNQAYKIVKRFVENKKFLVKKRYDKQARILDLSPGSLVMIKNNSRKGKFPMPKLNERFTGPYRILRNDANRNLLVKDVYGRQKTYYVHANRCKLYKPENDCFPKFETELKSNEKRREKHSHPAGKISCEENAEELATADASKQTNTHSYNLRSNPRPFANVVNMPKP